jgi:predicted PurR-regulated permease PerM
MKKGDLTNKYVFFSILGLAIALSIFIVFPFLTSIITGAILAYVLYPVYSILKKKMPAGLAAFLVAILIVLLITVPAFFIVKNLTGETHYVYLRAKQQIMSGELIEDRCYGEGFICQSVRDINEMLKDENIKTYIINFLNDFLTYVTKKIGEIIFSVPKLIVHLMVILFTAYYSLKDGKTLIRKVTKVIPLKVHHQDEIFKQFNDVTWAVIYGNFIVALVQGALGAFGFWIFGINGFLWWGIVMAFFALIPFVGTGIIWFPASVYLALSGYLQGEQSLIWKGLGLFIYGLVVVSSVDNVIRPYIVAGRAKVHPLLILLGVIGGLFMFGVVGILVGPLVLALLQTLFSILEREKQPHVKELDIIGKSNHKKRR